MKKIDSQLIVLYKIVDNADVRQYSAISGDRKGIATYCRAPLKTKFLKI